MEFESIYASNIEIIDITYLYTVPVAQKSSLNDIQDFQGCLSGIFNIMEDQDNNISLLYKRISHFNKVDSIEAFITYLFKHRTDPQKIIKKLMVNYNLKLPDATAEYAGWIASQELKHTHNKLKIINNPGFPINIHWVEGETHIYIEEINNIYYLQLLPIYLNSIIKLIQYKTLVPEDRVKQLTEDITSICKKTSAGSPPQINDIISSAEKNYMGQEEEEEEVSGLVRLSGEENMVETALNFFGSGSDEEDTDDETYSSSIKSSDSETDEEKEGEGENLLSLRDPIQQTWIDRNPLIEKDSADNAAAAAAAAAAATPTRESIYSLTTEEEEKNIDGISLTNPNYFQRRLEKADPILFLKKKRGKFKQYSRSCAANIKRQPLILTEAEFQKIKQTMPEKIKMAVKYGSTPEKQFWYICPQYWCLSTNQPLTTEDLDEAKRDERKLCGSSTDPYENIIPRNAKTVPPGKYIYSRVDFLQKKRKQVRESLYPSFFVGKHPNAKLCIPCCFNKPGGKWERDREKCGTEIWPPPKKGKKKAAIKMKVETKVIKESSKFPLEQKQWGFLPMNIKDFLQIPYANENCNADATICILRQGVEYSPTQSFIAALASISNPHNPPNIVAMKRKITRALTLDNFITYQHGTLVESFKTDIRKKIDKSYHSTNLYQQLHETVLGTEYLKEIIASFENFKKYLNDNNIIIDYEYLWDIICTPNNLLFKQGLNLIILVIPNNDITQKVDIICPSNHYANTLFNGKYPTAIILLRDDFYEPIVQRQKMVQREDNIQTTFSLIGNVGGDYPWSLQPVIQQLGNVVTDKCKLLPAQIAVKFGPQKKRQQFPLKHNISVLDIFKRLKKTKYQIKTQIVNLHTKVIGVMVEDKGTSNEVFIPSAPSPIQTHFAYLLGISDVSWWQNYAETRDMLENIYELTKNKKKIPCKPLFKIIHEGKIIGILTQTNQFVPTIPETLEDTHGDTLIPYPINVDISQANKIIWETTKPDQTRLEIIHHIRLETNFYNAFRNTVRILLQQYKYKETKLKIENIISNLDMQNYWRKLKEIIELLERLLEPFVEFIEFDINNINIITTCLNLKKDTCNKHPCAFVEDNDQCKLLIPQTNLISKNDNKTIYFGRLGDELLRYSNIQSFLLEENSFVSFQDINYNLRDDELLLLEENLINKENNYFTDLQPIVVNKYIKYPRTFYNTEPHEHISYSNNFKLGI